MANWWEAYPVVSADDAGAQAMLSEAKPAKAAKATSNQGGKWWESYPAIRDDAGPESVLAGIKANKEQQDERAKLHAAQQSLETYGEAPHVAAQIVTDTSSLVRRLFGQTEQADQLNRDSDVLSQAMAERDAAQWRSEESPEGMSMLERAGQYVPFVKQGVRGAARSLGSALLGAKGGGALLGAGKVAAGGARGAAVGAARGGAAGAIAGAAQGAGVAARGAMGAGGSAYGAIGLASAQEANKAITEGADAGLEGSALAGYVASQGIIEALPATVMQRLGMGGVEALIAGKSIRGGIKAGIIEGLKRFPEESIEEISTELLHAVETEYKGIDPRALDGDRLSSLVADTVLQTFIMSAGAGASQSIAGAMQGEPPEARAQRLARLQEIRSKGFVSINDAKNLNLEGKNRKERLASADAEIERLTQPSPLPEESFPNFGNRPQDGVPPAQPEPISKSIKIAQDRFRAKAAERREVELWSDPGNPLRFAVTEPEAAAELAKKPTYLPEDFEQALGVSTPDPKLRRQWKTWLMEAISLEPDVVQALQQEPSDTLSSNWTRVADGVQPPKSASVEVKQTSFGTLVRLKPGKAQPPAEQVPPDPATPPAATQPGATPTLPNPARETITPANDTNIGKNVAGEDLYERADGSRYRMRNDRKDRPDGYPDFGGDLAPVETPSTAGLSEGTGTKPTASPTVSPDAPAKPETSMGETAGEKQPSEARADNPRFKFGQVIPAEEADRVVSELRAGDERSKNKGQGRVSEGIKEPLVVSTVPLSEFDTPDPDYETYMKFLESSTDPARVESYAKQKIDTPVFVTQARDTGQLIAADGGHRIVAAAKRGDKEVLALVPVAVHERLHPTESKGTVPPTPAPVESKWQSETRSKLEAVPAFKNAKIETDEKAGTARVTRADGLATTVHFDADEKLAKAATKIGRKQIYGLYFRKNGETEGRIYIHSKANHANILNHEVMHWLEDAGVVTKAEVEQYGGTEAIAEKYGKWASLKQRKKDSFFQRIYDALEPLFSSQRRFFEEVGKRQTGASGWKPAPKADVSITESPDLKLETSRREKKNPQFPITAGSPVTVYRRGKDGKEEMQEGVVEDFADHMPGNIKVRLGDGSLVTPLLVDVGPRLKPADTAPVPQQPKGGGPTTTAEQVPPLQSEGLDLSVSGQSKPIPGMEDEEARYTVHNRKPDVIPDTFSVVIAGKPRGKGWATVKGTGMSAKEAYDRAVRMFTDKREVSADKWKQVSENKWELGTSIIGKGDDGLFYPTITTKADYPLSPALGLKTLDEAKEWVAAGGVNKNRKPTPLSEDINKWGPFYDTEKKRLIDSGVSEIEAHDRAHWLTEANRRKDELGLKSDEDMQKWADAKYEAAKPKASDEQTPSWLRQHRKAIKIPAKELLAADKLKDMQAIATREGLGNIGSTFADARKRVRVIDEIAPAMLDVLVRARKPRTVESLRIQSDFFDQVDVYDAMKFLEAKGIVERDMRSWKVGDPVTYVVPEVAIEVAVRSKFPDISQTMLDRAVELAREHREANTQWFRKRVSSVSDYSPRLSDYGDPRIWEMSGRSIKMVDISANTSVDAFLEDYQEPTAEEKELEKLPQGIPAYVISGMQRDPAKISGQMLTGRPVGVAIGPRRMSDNVISKIAAHVNRGGTLFVDSGMFGTVKKGKIGEEPNWAMVFDEYSRVLEDIKPANRRNVMLVAPDYLVKIQTADGKDLVIGDTMRTLDLQERYARQIGELMDKGSRIIIPIQRDMSDDPMSLGEIASLASDPLDLTSGNFAWGIPYNEAAWPDDQILKFVEDNEGSGMHIHLLGGGKARAEKLWDEIKRIDPTVKLTGDAATEARNAYRADKTEQSAEQPQQAETSGSLSIDEFADIFANPEQAKPEKKRTGRKPPEVKPPKQKSTGKKKAPSEGVKEGLDEAKAGADLILKGLKDLGSTPFSGPPINADIARGMGMLANGLIKAGKYKFVEFIEEAVKMIGAPAVRYLGPYLEAGWNKKAETDDRLDSATSVTDILMGKLGEPAVTSTQVRIANRVRDALENGEELTSPKFFAIADEEFGGTRANNDYGDSQATDALELGVNLFFQGKTDADVSAFQAKAIVGFIQETMELVPRHRGRTGNKDLMQQFSTPPAYAYVVNWIANITSDDVVLEPSAGMGGIAIHAANSGATVYGNELDPERAGGLRELPLKKVFTEDAEQIGAILKGKMPGLNVILMNPPFSRAGMRMGDKMVQGTDRKHIDEALTLLPEGGRLVAIVGAGLHKQGQKMTQWLDDMPYQLVANIEVAREVYRGYGTEFPTRVLVIDKVPRTDSTLVRKVEDLSELIDVAEEVRDARPVRQVEQTEDESDSPQGTDEDGQGTGAADDALDPTDTGVPDATDSGTGQTDDGQRSPDRGDGLDDGNAPAGTTGSNAGGRRGGGGGGRKAGKSGGSGGKSKTKSGGDASPGKPKSGSRGGTDRGRGLTKVKATSQRRAQSAKTELGTSTFEDYVPNVVVEGASPHPAPIVESAAMSAVDAPRIDYEVDLMPGVFEGYVNEDGIYVGISDIQLEAIAMAGAAHEQKLPNGERRGFLIGDGTGVGKAREALGIIMDDFIKRGTGARRKAVLITKNDGLVKDAVKEWIGVGGDAAEMQALSNVGSGVAVNYESGVLNLSYDTLKGEASIVAKANGNTLSRVDQIVEWVGPDFDGVVVFDEAHLMANSLDTGIGNQAKGASMRALAGVDLQQRLPNARFVYLSATAATEVRNLAYAERLGLWGPETSFATKHAFINEIEAGGVAAMEKVAADMKAMGMYIARNLSYDDGTEKGRVEFDRIMHTLTDDQGRVYDKLSEAWLKVLADIDTALGITNNEKGKSRILSAFWSSNQRFWNDVVTTMMAPTLIQNIEKDLAAGRSVVIQLSTTKEAATTRAIAGMKEGQTYDEIDASPRRSLMEYVERAFPTQRHETYIDDAGNERSRPVFDSNGDPVHDPQAVAMKERLLDEIGSLDVAARGPIDMILDHFGIDMAAEISGRSQRLVKGEDGRLELEKRGKASARADRDAFMDGKKRILLFSEAGGTGASYHASLSANNQQRRSHYLWQPGWSAPVAVQGLGRAHRSNQASAPILHLLEPNLEGYKRFISTIARRLGQLGALTKGQRTAADAGLFGANDNLESTEANGALFQFMRDAVAGNIEGIDREFLIRRLGLEQLAGEATPTPEMFTITQFLNRMLNLPRGEQNQVFREFQSRMDSIVAQAIQDGTLDQGMETLKAEKIVKAKETIVNEHKTGAKTKLVQLTVTHKVKLRTYEDMLREVSGYEQFGLEGFFKSLTSGKVLAVINQNRTSQDDKGRTLHDAMAISVDGNTYGHSLEQFEKAQYWEELSRDQAKKLWDEQYAKAPTTRDSTEYLLTGALLPIWNKIPGERSRVVRALTTDGEMILGRVVPERMLQRTLDSLGIAGGDQRQYTPREAIQAIYQGGTVQLANGWTIKKRTIDGEDNIEIMGPDYASKDAITNAGGFSRRIDYATRFFIPFNDSEGEVLGEITRISPIASITMPRGGSVAQMADPTRQSRSGGTGAAARIPGEGIAAADIQKTAERLFKVPIRHGNFSQRAAGIYKWMTGRNGPPSPEVVRTAEGHYANVAVIAHEVAHHIDETTKAVDSMPAAVRQEVAKLDYDPTKNRAFEGWAEFLRRYMTEPPIDVAGNMMPNPAVDAPQTLKWFEETFLQAQPGIAKAIGEFRDYAQQFANQSVFARIGTMITDRKPQDLRYQERWKQRAKRFANRVKTNFLDKFHTLKWIQEEASAKGYKGVGIYNLTMAYFLSASSHATIAFEEGVRSLTTGKPIGKTRLWDLSRHLKNDGEYDEAIRYALARHTLYMDATKPGYNTGVDVEDAQAWVDEAESLGKADRYEDFAKELAQFNDDLIMMLVDAGALSRGDASKLLNYYRDATGAPHYFPLHRISDVESSDFAGTSAGFVNLGTPVKGRSRKGSGRQIIDPIDATITRAIKFYGRAIQARQAHTLAQTLDPKMGGVGGMGGLMDRVPAKRVVHHGTIEEILGTLVDSGTIDADQARAMRVAARILDPANGLPSQKDLDWFANKHNIADWTKSWSDMESAAETEPDALAVISLWRPDYTPNAQKRTVMIYDRDGNKLMYEMDNDLYQVATGMQDIQFNTFMNIMRHASRYFKSGAVGLSTGFGAANLLRDYWEFQGKANHVKGLRSLGKPWEMLGRYVAEKTKQSMVGKYVGRKLGLTYKPNNALIRLYEESGGKVYSVVGQDASSRSIYRRKKLGKSTMSKLGLSIKRPMDTAENVLSNLQELIAISDAPPRLADAEAALAEHGFVAQGDKWLDTRTGTTVDYLPESARIAAAVAMAEATINFKRIGAAGAWVEAFFPFFNATTQATYRQYQQLKNLKSLGQDTPEGDRAMRTLVYIAAIASTGVLYWLLRHDDDDWRNQDAWLRDGYWTWGLNGKTYVRIPKPRDFGVVGNVAENMLDAWAHEDARETAEIFKREIGGRIPTGGGMARGLVETYIADYDYFRGRELEDESVEDLPKQYRTSSYTSRMSDYLGKQFGKTLNTSPIQFEHLLNNATGGMYSRLTDTYDAAQDGRLGPEHIPFARGLLIDRQQTRPIGEFYQKKEELEVQAATQKIEQEKVSPEVADKLAHFGWISEVMTKLRSDEAKLGKKRTFEHEKYITGLARAALGYKEQESNPNPLTAKNLPEGIREAVDHYRQLAVVGAADRLSPRSVFKSDDAYASQKTQIERAEAKLRMLNLSYDEARQSLLAYWEKTHGSVTEMKNGQPILKDAVRNRLSKLKQLLKAD